MLAATAVRRQAQNCAILRAAKMWLSWGDDELSNSADRSTSGRRVAVYLTAAVVLVVCTGVGSRLVDLPSNLPRDFWGWVLLAFGACLLVTTAVVTTFLPEVVKRVERILGALPGRLKQRGSKFRQPFRIIVGVVVVVIVSVAATFIQSPDEAAALEPGELVVMSAFDESPSDPRRMLIDQWNETHPDNQVKTIDAPGETDRQHERMVNDARDGGENAADIYVLDNVWMPEFIKNNYIRPIDESLRSSANDEFFENVLKTCTDLYGHKDGLWALPLNADAGMLFYRSELEDVGRPTSWDDYGGESAKDALREVKRRPELAGSLRDLEAAAAAQFANEEILTVNALEAIWAADGEVINRDGDLVLNQDRTAVEFDDRAREGLENLATAYRDREIALGDSESADEDKSVAAFKGGRSLFMRNWPVTYDKLKNSTDKDAVSFNVASLPGPSALGGQNLAISARTGKPRAAQALIDFLTSPSSQLILFEVGGFAPARTDVYKDASRIARPYAQDLRSSIEHARLRLVTPYYTEFSREFRLGVLRALRDRGTFEPDFPRKLVDAANGR